MYKRIVVGSVAAWLLGAATATGASMLAVSLLGQGITGTSGILLTPAAVNRALASETARPAGPASRDQAGGPAPTPLATGRPGPAATVAAPPPAATVLTSSGGDVMASCLASGAYLDSWSPLSGYEVGDVTRGPARTARVAFTSPGGTVTMAVSCSAGVPSATTYSGGTGHGDD